MLSRQGLKVRAQFGGRLYRDSHADSDLNTDRYSYCHQDSHANSNAHCDPDKDCDADGNADLHGNSNGYSLFDANPATAVYPYRYSNNGSPDAFAS